MAYDNPLISIVVITYNSSKYILETLESIKSQSYPNIELIVSDDYSTDNTIMIVNEWLNINKKRFKRYKLISSKVNSGIPANCNRGFSLAKGKYIKLIAGDDLLINTCIEDNVAFALENNSCFTVSRMSEITEKGLKPRINSYRQEALIDFIRKGKNQLKYYLRFPVFINSPTFFFKMDAIQEIDFFDETFFFLEDQPLVIKFLKKGYLINFMDKCTVYYRTHPKSVSFSNNYNQITLDLYNCLKKYRLDSVKKTDIISLFYILGDWISYKKQLSSENIYFRFIYKILYRLVRLVYHDQKRR